MTKLSVWRTAALTAAVLLAPAGAQEGAPQEETYQGIPYRSGGVGRDERDALERASQGYNLRLIFARKQHTAFLADVQVRVTDAQGQTVLDGVSNGPLFFTRLPPGTYRVEATAAGITQEQSVEVKSGSQARLAFYWDIQTD